uniref:Uncharacterized protein n=1 Tax=Sciurus vulgaris TaxID=55149 RepID=A0A8D2JMA5_SCIVU
ISALPDPSSPVKNLFQFLGDLSHLLTIILLLLKIWKSCLCAGISGKSQVLFTVVFTAPYLDLFTNYISFYNTCMKVVYIACSFTTVWMIYSKFKATYDENHDTFRMEFLLFMVSKTGEVETTMSHSLHWVSTLHLFNWIWCYHFGGFFDLIAIVANLVQTSLYWWNETLYP